MSNMLASGIAWLNSQRKLYASETVLYRRGAYTIPALAATRGQTEFAIDTGSAVRIENNQQDWIIAAAELVLNGQPTQPQRGDQIIPASDPTQSFEVQIPDDTAQPFRLDPTGQQMRIHSYRVS